MTQKNVLRYHLNIYVKLSIDFFIMYRNPIYKNKEQGKIVIINLKTYNKYIYKSNNLNTAE